MVQTTPDALRTQELRTREAGLGRLHHGQMLSDGQRSPGPSPGASYLQRFLFASKHARLVGVSKGLGSRGDWVRIGVGCSYIKTIKSTLI